jgi:hypothetical protein
MIAALYRKLGHPSSIKSGTTVTVERLPVGADAGIAET